MIYSCRTALKLKNESFHRPLKLREKIGLHLHYFVCKACKQVGQQLDFICRLSQRYGRQLNEQLQTYSGLSKQARLRISNSIKTHMDGQS
jgi:hypothetical protein